MAKSAVTLSITSDDQEQLDQLAHHNPLLTRHRVALVALRVGLRFLKDRPRTIEDEIAAGRTK